MTYCWFSGCVGDSLQLWLENLQCGSLLSAFLEKEFSDLDTIAQHLTRDDVKKMGVEDARQEKIMSAVEELRRKTEMKSTGIRTICTVRTYLCV